MAGACRVLRVRFASCAALVPRRLSWHVDQMDAEADAPVRFADPSLQDKITAACFRRPQVDQDVPMRGARGQVLPFALPRRLDSRSQRINR